MNKLISFLKSQNQKKINLISKFDDNISVEKIKESYLDIIEQYITGSISFDICVKFSIKLWFKAIENETIVKNYSELTLAIYNTSEGSFSNFIFLTSQKYLMNPGIKSFVNDLKNNYKKYSQELKREDILSNNYFDKNFVHFNVKNLKIKSILSKNEISIGDSYTETKIILPFPISEVSEQLEKMSEQEFENLFVAVCKEHDDQKISIDTITGLSCCILEHLQIKNNDFKEVLIHASRLAFLERFSANSETVFSELSNAGKVINMFVKSKNL